MIHSDSVSKYMCKFALHATKRLDVGKFLEMHTHWNIASNCAYRNTGKQRKEI